MKRFRALQVADRAAKHTRLLDEAAIEASIQTLRRLKQEDGDDLTDEEEQKQRRYLRVDVPVIDGVSTRQFLSEIDHRFADLDPLVVMEELAEADGKQKGGKNEDGEGRTGPARALSRLAVMCGALEYAQRPNESFDEAVDRARRNLLVTRSRIRKTPREFPGRIPEADDRRE